MFMVLRKVLGLSVLLAIATSTVASSIEIQAYDPLNREDSYFIKAMEKSKLTNYGEGKIIAVLDSGINDDNHELRGQVIAEYDFTEDKPIAVDRLGHGTKMASIIASHNDGKGITGIAYKAKLIDVKVVSDDGDITTENIINGIDFAVKNGAQVINMSFSSGSYDRRLELIINKYNEAGVFFVSSSGNNGSNKLAYPAKYVNVMAVGSFDRAGNSLAGYSNYNNKVIEVIQDGIWGFDGHSYKREIGTSLASAVYSSYVHIKVVEPSNTTNDEGHNSGLSIPSEGEYGEDFTLATTFQDADENNYLNSLIKYQILEREIGVIIPGLNEMKMGDLISYSNNGFVNLLELSNISDVGEFNNSISSFNSYLLLFDMFSDYSKVAYGNEYDNFVDDYNEGKAIDQNSLVKVIDDLNSLQKDIEDFKKNNHISISISKGINNKFKKIIAKTKGKKDPQSKMIRKYSRMLSGIFSQKDISTYKTSYINKKNYLDTVLKGVSVLEKTLSITETALNGFNSMSVVEKKSVFLRIKAADYLTSIALLSEDSFSENQTGTSRKIFQEVSNSIESQVMLNELVDNIVRSAYVQVIGGVANDLLGPKNFLLGKLGNAVKNSPPAALVLSVLEGDFDEVSSSYMYILYRDFITGLNTEALIITDHNRMGYIRNTDITKHLVSIVALRNFYFHSINYLKAMLVNPSNWDSNSEASPVSLIYDIRNNYKVNRKEIEYKYKPIDNIVDRISYFQEHLVQAALHFPRVGADLIKKYNLYNLITGRYPEEKNINTYLDNLLSQGYGTSSSSFYGKYNSIINAVFDEYKKNITAMAGYQHTLTEMLSNSTLYDVVADSNENNDEVRRYTNDIKIILDSIGENADKINLANIRKKAKEGVIYELETGVPFFENDFFGKMTSPILRKDFFIMMMKAFGLNPYYYDDTESDPFLSSLSDGRLSVFPDIDYNAYGELTLDEKIWLLYGKKLEIIHGNSERNDELLPFDYITRQEAFSFVGRLIKKYVSGYDKFNFLLYKTYLATLSVNDREDVLSRLDNFDTRGTAQNVAITVFNQVASGSCRENGTRVLNLDDSLTYHEASILSMNVFKRYIYEGDELVSKGSNYDSYDCAGGTSNDVNNGSSLLENVEIESIPEVVSGGDIALNVRTKIQASEISKYRFEWDTHTGILSDYEKKISNDKVISTVKFTAPVAKSIQLVSVDVYLLDEKGNNVSKRYYVKVIPDENSGSDISLNPTVAYSVLYLSSDDKFKISYQASDNTDKVIFSYSYDKANWSQIISATSRSGVKTKIIPDSKNHTKIYFKAVSSDSLSGKETVSPATPYDYTPKPVDQTEFPNIPQMHTLADKTDRSSVVVGWYPVKDSQGNANANYYDIAIADNSNFTNQTVLNAGSTTRYTAQNLADSTKFYFKVRAVNSKGTSRWSGTQSISINVPDNPVFETTIQTPSDGATGVSKTPSFRWRASDEDGDTLEYYVRIGESVTDLRYSSGWITDIERFVYSDKYDKPLKPNTTYFWQVDIREKGHTKDYYGGTYITSPMWSFTTVSAGSDLAILSAELLDQLQPDHNVRFKATIKNIGTETAKPENIKISYKKNGTVSDFRSSGWGYMKNELLPGETEDVIITASFRDEVITIDGKIYDNVLIESDSFIVFDMPNLSNQDVNPVNNKFEYKINYESTGKPVFDYFSVGPTSVYEGNQSFPLYTSIGKLVGREAGISFRVEDDLKITKATIEYRLNASDTWKLIKTIVNDKDYVSDNFQWIVPNEKRFITNTMQIRVRAYENDTSYSEKVSYPFPVYDNKLNVTIADIGDHKINESFSMDMSIDSTYKIRSIDIDLQSSRNEELYFRHEENGFSPSRYFNLQIPNDNRFASNDAILKVTVTDIHSNKVIRELPLKVLVDTQLDGAFGNIIDVYNKHYTSFPSGSSLQKTENTISKLVIDDNNVVHMVVSSVAWWIASGESSFSRNFKYLYLTYDYNSKVISSPIPVFTMQILNSGSFPSKSFNDFNVVDNTPVVVTYDSNGQKAEVYTLNGGSFQATTVSINENIALLKLDAIDGKIFLSYLHYPENNVKEDRRMKVAQVYPSIEPVHNLLDEYQGGSVRLHKNYAYFYYRGLVYSADDSLTITGGTVHNYAEQPKYAKADFTSYNPLYKEIQVDDNYHLQLVKNNWEKVDILDLSDGIDSILNRSAVWLEVTVFEDNTALVVYSSPGENGDGYKVALVDIDTRAVSLIPIGKYMSIDKVSAYSSINTNKILAVANPDRGSAFLAVGDFSKDIVAPSVSFDNQEVEINKGDSITLQWHSDDIDIERFEIYKIIDNTETLLSTINSSAPFQYSYVENEEDNYSLKFKIVAYDSAGNTGFDILSLNLLSHINFTAFDIDKTNITLGDTVTFTWGSNGHSRSEYTVYQKAPEETQWKEIFTVTGVSSKTYVFEDIVGDYFQFKIVSGDSERVSEAELSIGGEILQFNNSNFDPKGEITEVLTSVAFKWDDTLREDPDYPYIVWLKKEGETSFTKIGETINKSFFYDAPITTSFIWKVTSRFRNETISSEEIVVNLNIVTYTPVISETNFSIGSGNPQVEIKFVLLSGVSSYQVLRSENGVYSELTTVQLSPYIDSSVHYGKQYNYKLVALDVNGNDIGLGDAKIVNAFFEDSYDVLIQTPNYQTLNTTNINVDFAPTKTVPYESYELLLGTSPTSLSTFTVTPNRSVFLDGLDYATNYYLEIYPVDFGGNRLSSTPARLTFTTGFDQREVTVKPVITLEEVGKTRVALSWTASPNADQYYVCRSEDDSAFDCFARTTNLFYADEVNIQPGSSYVYKIKAFNSYSSLVSDASQEVQVESDDSDTDGFADDVDNCPAIANPDQLNSDTDAQGDACDDDDDNDGLPDDWENANGLDSKNANDASEDADNDGISNQDEYASNTDPNDSTSVPALQQVSISNCSRITSRSEVRCDIAYTTTDANQSLSGIGFRVHYDASKLEWLGFENVLTGNVFNANISPLNDVADDDNDTTTTEHVGVAWAGLQGQWPGQVLPVTLFTARFKASENLAVGDTTTIRFSPLDTANGYGFKSEPRTLAVQNNCTLDLDGDGQARPLTDGLLTLRYMFSFRGDALTSGAVGSGASRQTATDIEQYLEGCVNDFDIDGDGASKPLTDGLLILRYLFSFRGDALINGAVGTGGTRNDDASVTEYMDTRN